MKNLGKQLSSLKLTTRILIVALIFWIIFLTHSVFSAHQVSNNADRKFNGEKHQYFAVDANQKIDLPNFTGISLNIPAELHWRPGNSSSCSVNQNLEGIFIGVKKDTVIVANQSNFWQQKKLPKGIVIVCISPSLAKTTIEGAGSMRLTQINTEYLQAVINGAGELVANGSAAELNGAINGTGTMQLRDLNIQLAQLEINGMGEFIVPKAKQVDVEINGMGSVKISASTETVGKDINGMGSIDIID
ncbi:MAG: DUF2807 domain-containing protein [Cellvibrionaceae bacterium]|nr:DUF2807 domain-containing protein [Cellvibrionaceae bacterium]